jgi:AP-1 complex subunit beta-1
MHTNGEPLEEDIEAATILNHSRKEAIQKTIMSMTLGKDVSALFPDVLKNIATADLDQKKLVYLYLMYVLEPMRDARRN